MARQTAHKEGAIIQVHFTGGASQEDSSGPIEKALWPLGYERTRDAAKVADGGDMKNEKYLLPPYDPDSLAELFMTNPYHQKAIGVKAFLVPGLGWEIVGDVKDKRPDADYEALLNWIDAQKSRTGKTFLETLIEFCTDYEIFGYSFFEASSNAEIKLDALFNLPGKDMRLGPVYTDKQKTKLKEVRAYQSISWGQDPLPFEPWNPEAFKANMTQYVMMKGYNPKNRFYGYPDYIGAIGAILLDRNAQEFNIGRFDNNMIPDVIITVSGGNLDANAIKNLKQFLDKNYRGARNSGRGLILSKTGGGSESGDIKVEKMNPDTKEASFRFLRHDNRDEIISAHGVPPRLMGVISAGSLGGGSEAREQLRIFKEIVLAPRQRRLEKILNRIFAEGLGIKGWGIRFNTLELGAWTDDANFYEKMIQNQILDADESRAELGYPPRETQTKKADALVRSLVTLRKQLEEHLERN